MSSQKKLSISAREFGRGKPAVTRFESLEAAAIYIKDRWQGAEYCDGADGFHTDYCTYQLKGFALADVGTFGFDEFGRTFVFKSDAKPICTNGRRCMVDDCDGSHCRKCGGHFIDFYQTKHTVCSQCSQEAFEAECDAAEYRSMNGDGFDARAPFPHASDPHWSDPRADHSHF